MLWFFGAIVLTWLKWLAYTLALSLLVTSLMSQTERLWTGQVVVRIMTEPMAVYSGKVLRRRQKDYCCGEAELRIGAVVCGMFVTALSLPGKSRGISR